MTEEVFWELIARSAGIAAKGLEAQCDFLTDELLKYSEQDIISFENIMREKMETASSFPVLAATFIVCSYINDDVYEDFRAWLVAQGKANFEKAIKDPNEICSFLNREQTSDLGGVYMLFVAANAFVEKTGKTEEEFYDLVTYPEEKELEQKWPENKEQYRKLLPQLYDKFWNQERIEQLLEEDMDDD